MSGKVLIIEDNGKNRLLLRDILSYYGYEVSEARDGREGMQLARELLPELILLDLQMPVMDGFTVFGLLKSDPATRGLKVIALTSFAMKGDREKILETGFDDYIAKPIDTRELPVIVRRHLDRTEKS